MVRIFFSIHNDVNSFQWCKKYPVLNDGDPFSGNCAKQPLESVGNMAKHFGS